MRFHADVATGELLGTVATPRRGGTISPLAQSGELVFRLFAFTIDVDAATDTLGSEIEREELAS